MSNKNLVRHLKNTGILKSRNIEEALVYVDRKDFVPEEYSTYAYNDNALPIGHGQTISQPYTVVFMLELLNPQKDQKILDVGFGSGWQTALLSKIVGEKGHIYAFEIVPEVFTFGENNLSKYPRLKENTSLFLQTAEKNIPDESFDRIIVGADIKETPSEWKEKLKVGGTIVYPSDQGIYKMTKEGGNAFEKKFYSGFVFVPFVSKAEKS